MLPEEPAVSDDVVGSDVVDCTYSPGSSCLQCRVMDIAGIILRTRDVDRLTEFWGTRVGLEVTSPCPATRSWRATTT